MGAVRVEYHHEPEGWWADSPDVKGFVATGQDVSEVRALVREGLPFYLEQEDVDYYEVLAGTETQPVEVQWSGVGFAVPVTSVSTGWTENLVSQLPWLGVGSPARTPSEDAATPVG